MNGNDRRKAEEAKKLAEKAAKAEAKVLSQKNKLAEIERQKDQRLKAKDEKQRANNQKAAERAKKEEEKVYAAAKKQALEKEKMALIAEKKKQDLIQAKKQSAVAAEAEKKVLRKSAARKADAERLWTPNDLNELRVEFNKFDTKKNGTIESIKVSIICETLGETLSNVGLSNLLTKMKQDEQDGINGSKGFVEWVNFLNALVPKRDAARKKGIGLLEKFGLKKAAAEKKKTARIKAEEEQKAQDEVVRFYYYFVLLTLCTCSPAIIFI